MERGTYSITREELLERLWEPFRTLSPEDLKAAKELGATDPEVKLALEQSQAFEQLSEVKVYGKPRSSDTAFLVALREKLAGPAPVARGAFGTGRLAVLAAGLGVLVIALILATGNQMTQAPVAQVQSTEALETMASALDVEETIIPDSISDTTADPESLAAYLDMPDMADNWDFDADSSDQPLTDELLSLDPLTLQEVMNDLEKTNFF